MKMFFPNVQEVSARRFCAMALVKLCGNCTWSEAAEELDLPIEAGSKMANRCIMILGGTGKKEVFGDALREIVNDLSKNPNKVDYGRRRDLLSSLSDIPAKPWEDMCRATGINVGLTDSRRRYAAVWLWAELTGGDWRLAPALPKENKKSSHTVYSKLSRTIFPKLASHLCTYGATLVRTKEGPR